MSELKVFNEGKYRIRVQGTPDPEWSEYYGNMLISTEIDPEEHAVATLTGQVQDQAALLGVLNRLVDMGLPLLLVQYIPDQISETLEEREE
ncbi:MAG: hypothetical protein KAS38_05650 [Anaerolineales bacterium]|nr:hypothetical protein [Anaerolineales bacterium]